MTLEEMLQWMRHNGWLVAVHNDYRQAGGFWTFWLFTNSTNGRFVKGEAKTDTEAVKLAYVEAYGIGLRGS
jgi:hypothetical protein